MQPFNQTSYAANEDVTDFSIPAPTKVNYWLNH